MKNEIDSAEAGKRTLEECCDLKKYAKTSNVTGIDSLLSTVDTKIKWRAIRKGYPNMDVEYAVVFKKEVADNIFLILEEQLEYFSGDLSKIKVFGKWHNIPRKQVTFGDEGLTYKYSGITTMAQPWPPILAKIRDLLCRITGYMYNFVLVNRYQDGNDKIGEHKDDERELDKITPIASISLGQPREFYFRHQDARPPKKLPIDKVTVTLEHGSLLMIKPPTNQFWYHALPPRKTLLKPRINLTFRKIVNAREPL